MKLDEILNEGNKNAIEDLEIALTNSDADDAKVRIKQAIKSTTNQDVKEILELTLGNSNTKDMTPRIKQAIKLLGEAYIGSLHRSTKVFLDNTEKVEFKMFQNSKSRKWSVIRYENGEEDKEIEVGIDGKKAAFKVAKAAADKETKLSEQETKDTLHMVKVRGNFYGGKYYEDGLDSLFVLASSPEEAVKIAKDNIGTVEQHFRNKKYTSGKKAISPSDKKKFKPDDVKDAKASGQEAHSKVLHKDGEVKPFK